MISMAFEQGYISYGDERSIFSLAGLREWFTHCICLVYAKIGGLATKSRSWSSRRLNEFPLESPLQPQFPYGFSHKFLDFPWFFPWISICFMTFPWLLRCFPRILRSDRWSSTSWAAPSCWPCCCRWAPLGLLPGEERYEWSFPSIWFYTGTSWSIDPFFLNK